jgi:copper chaperone
VASRIVFVRATTVASSPEIAMQFHVPSMTCGHCVRTITRAIQTLDPQARVDVDLDAQRVAVTATLTSDQVVAVLAAQDYAAMPISVTTPAAKSAGRCCGTCHG